MTLEKETEKLIARAVKKWSSLKKIQSRRESHLDEFDSPTGHFFWDNPNILWLYCTGKEEGYEGSQTQIGLTKDGKLVWEFQSHCSCNSYKNTKEVGNEWPEDVKKHYELSDIPKEWEAIIQYNFKKLLKSK